MSTLVLCAYRDPAVSARLRAAFDEWVPGMIGVEDFTNGVDLANRASAAVAEGNDLPVIFSGIGLDALDGIALLRKLHDSPPLRSCRKVLLANATATGDADVLLQRGALHGRLDPDFDDESLKRLLRNLLTDYVVHSAPHLIDDLHGLLDLRSLATAFSSAREKLRQLNQRLSEVERSVIVVDGMSDDKVEAAMIDEFDLLLNHPERMQYAAGEILVNEGDDPGTIWIILSGRVKLFRTIEDDDVTFHSESAGRIVGLMSLSLQSPVFFSCRAVTETTALVLTREQVADAIRRGPSLSKYLITVILRSMARRNRRSAQLLVQVRKLNRQLGQQRDELSATLDELRATQEQLVDTTKMATLGNLAAGMAHELNNPISAILHASEHLDQDIESLLDLTPDLAVASEAIPVAKQIPPRSTRDERRLRDGLVKSLGIDANKAARLVTAGVENREDFAHYRSLERNRNDEEILNQLEYAGQIAISLRNISNCSNRIAALVRSLKIYAREDEEHLEPTDLNGTIDDVLLILANRLRDVEIEKHYASLPQLLASPSQLQQVWTNLVSNALQALGTSNRITITTSSPNPGWQRVEVEDHGVGVPEEARDRLFEARFTTRSGRVEFGLGLGLPISRKIVLRHGGDIRFESEPGRTVFIVDLPENPPNNTEPNESS